MHKAISMNKTIPELLKSFKMMIVDELPQKKNGAIQIPWDNLTGLNFFQSNQIS